MVTKDEIRKIIHEANMNYRPRKPSILERTRARFMLINNPRLLKIKRAIDNSLKKR